MGFSNWFKRHRRGGPPPAPKTAKKMLFVERPCIGCLRPFKKWGVSHIELMEQFCSKGCKTSFFHGYDLGLRVNNNVADWRRRR